MGFRIALAKATEMLFPRHGGRAQSARQFCLQNCRNNFLHGCKKLCRMPRTINSTVLRSKSVKVNFCMDAKINVPVLTISYLYKLGCSRSFYTDVKNICRKPRYSDNLCHHYTFFLSFCNAISLTLPFHILHLTYILEQLDSHRLHSLEHRYTRYHPLEYFL